MARTMSRCFLEGYAAFKAGDNVHHNPYLHDGDDWEWDWEAGWYEAENAYQPHDWFHLQAQSVTCNFDEQHT